MSSSSGVRPGALPLRMFTCGTEPEFDKSFSYRSGLENLPILADHIPLPELELIREGPLGVLLNFYESGFSWSAKLVHELLAHQLAVDKKYEIWTLCGGQPIRFSMKEFKIITGLNCDPYPMEEPSINTDPEFYSLLGLSEDRQPCFNMVVEKISSCSDWRSVDRIRLVYLLLVYRFLLASAPGKQVESNAHVLVLDREEFEAYPWGRVAFQYLIESIHKATADITCKTHNSYSVFGFVQVLQVWAYEAIPVFGTLLGNRKEGDLLPLLRWSGSRKRFTFDLPVKREPVLVNYLLDNNLEEMWDDEEEDERVDNMVYLVRNTSRKVFEKHMWEDKGLVEGPGVREVGAHVEANAGSILKKRKRTQEIVTCHEELMKYLDRKLGEMADKIHDVAAIVKGMDARLEKLEGSITGLQEKVEKIDSSGNGKEGERYDKDDGSNGKGKETEICDKEHGSNGKHNEDVEDLDEAEPNGKGKRGSRSNKESRPQKLAACSSKPERRNLRTFVIPTLKDIPDEDLHSEEDTVDCTIPIPIFNFAEEQISSSNYAVNVSETSSTKFRKMKLEKNNYAVKVKATIKKSPKLEKRQRKVPQKLKSPFKSTTIIPKMLAFPPSTVDDPFAPVDMATVHALDAWLTLKRKVNCAHDTTEEGETFFKQLRTPTTHISDAHIDAGMTLFRRRSTMSPCPYRDGRVAFMDSGFAVAIAHNYERFLGNPKNYTWKSGAADYYAGVLPLASSTNKQFGRDVDDIYMVINISGNHWVALAISIPNRSIHVYDSITAITKDEVIKRHVKPYAHMIPYLLQAFSSEKRGMSLAKYSISRLVKIPQNVQTGDCGIYALKYIECLALGREFKGLCDQQIKRIREKLAAEIFAESKDTGFY